MGAINNAFNQAVGSVAAAGLAIKHAKESDFSKMNTTEHSALVAKNQATEAEQAANEAKLGEKEAYGNSIDAIINNWGKEDEYNIAKKEYDDKRLKGKNPSYDPVQKKFDDWQAAERAIAEADNKIYSIQAMRQRALDQRAYADKASQIAAKAQQKYQSRWGGK